MKKIFFLFSLCSLFFFSNTDSLYAEETEYFHNVLYNSYNGLPTSEANDILQTKDGQIWIASYSSLIRYNGRTFVSYANRGFASIISLFEDSKGRLWVGTNNDGTVLYEKNTFYSTGIDQNLISYSTRAITENKEGDIIVGTAMGLYQVLDDLSIKNLDDPRLNNIYILDLISYGDNFTLGLTKAGDIFILQGTELVTYITLNEFGYNTPLSILPLDGGETFLIGTNDEYIVEMKRDSSSSLGYTFTKVPTKGIYHVNAIVKDSKDRIWLGSDSAVGFLDSDYNVSLLDYIAVGSFENICEDAEGNYWIASSKEGVLKLTRSQFRNVTSSLNNLIQVNGVEILDDLIYTVSPKGINIIDKISGNVIENELTRRYVGGYFRCVEKDNHGNLWFASYTNDQLIKYTPSTGTITPITEKQGLTNKRIRSTMVASDSRVWVATGNGVYIVDNDRVVKHFGTNEGIQNLEILSITEDLQGRIFVSTDGAGIYIFKDEEIIGQLTRASGLTTDVVLRTETDPHNGGTWIITGNSLAFYDTDNDDLKVIKFFPYSNNFDLLFYEDDIVILSSNGVYFTNEDDLMQGVHEPFPYLHKNHFDGLFSTPVANSFSRIYDGILYLCGYQNLTAYDLNVSSADMDYIPAITLPRILLSGKTYYPSSDKAFELPSSANYFELDVLIATFSLQDYNVSYMIENYDKAPHTSSYNNFKNPYYTNLPGGNYTFVVELIDGRTKDIVATERFNIKKEYTYYENPIVRSIFTYGGILLIVFLTNLFFKKRMEKMQKQKQVFTNIFREMVEMLSKIIDNKDTYTQGHSSRVGHYSMVIAKEMGFSEDEQFFIYGTGLLHDIGKISIPDSVLNKNGKLEPEEFEIIKTHPTNGANILESIKSWPDLHLGAGFHHERYDGKGYQQNLSGENIPLVARIICVADAFDAMYSSRIYRKKMQLSEVLKELENNAGTQFDPNVVEVFLRMLRSGQLDELLSELNPE